MNVAGYMTIWPDSWPDSWNLQVLDFKEMAGMAGKAGYLSARVCAHVCVRWCCHVFLFFSTREKKVSGLPGHPGHFLFFNNLPVGQYPANYPAMSGHQ